MLVMCATSYSIALMVLTMGCRCQRHLGFAFPHASMIRGKCTERDSHSLAELECRLAPRSGSAEGLLLHPPAQYPRMLRQAARRAASAFNTLQRGVSTSAASLEEGAQAAGPKEFAELWNKKAPSTLAVPELPSKFLPEEAAGSKVQGDLFPVNLYTPHHRLASAVQKDTVILPGMEGVFGVKANHVPVISQLRPGIVELHSGSEVEKYFISGGWAFVHPDGVTDIQALEAVTLDQVDAGAVKSALAQAQSAQANDDYEAAVNRTAVELYSALDSAMDSKA